MSSINKFNSEGYFDPTAYEALTAVVKQEKQDRFRPLVYVCSPFSGDVEVNIENARRYSRFAVDSGCIPITPHLFFPQFMNDEDPAERTLAIIMDLILLSKCTEIWVFGDTISNGMSKEIEKAKRKNMPIRYFTTKCEEVKKNVTANSD